MVELIDIADKDESKSLKFTRELLKKEGIEPSEENIFIAAACKEKGVAFLKGEGKVNIRKKAANASETSAPTPRAKTPINEKYSVTVNDKKFDVEVADADGKAEIKRDRKSTV